MVQLYTFIFFWL